MLGPWMPVHPGVIPVWVYRTSALLNSPNKRRNKNRASRKTTPSARPAFRPRSHRETSWGGDGTVIAPDSVRVSLPYETILEPAATLGSLYLYQFRGNSVYDPDYTGAGSQPAGFDVWAQLYNEYVVLSSHLEVEVICGSSATVEYVSYPSYNLTAPTASTDASARPYANRRVVNSVGSGVRGTLSSSMSTAQMMGVKPEAVVDDDAYGATVSTNPASAAIWYWNVVGQNINNTNTLADVLRIRIVYDVLFHDRIQLQLSSVARVIPRVPELQETSERVESLSNASSASTGASAAIHSDCQSAHPTTSMSPAQMISLASDQLPLLHLVEELRTQLAAAQSSLRKQTP